MLLCLYPNRVGRLTQYGCVRINTKIFITSKSVLGISFLLMVMGLYIVVLNVDGSGLSTRLMVDSLKLIRIEKNPWGRKLSLSWQAHTSLDKRAK